MEEEQSHIIKMPMECINVPLEISEILSEYPSLSQSNEATSLLSFSSLSSSNSSNFSSSSSLSSSNYSSSSSSDLYSHPSHETRERVLFCEPPRFINGWSTGMFPACIYF